MFEPSYYTKYIDLYKSGKTNDEESFLEYLENLTKEEWGQLLLDLCKDAPYPAIIQRDRKDYSVISYFSIFIAKLSTSAKSRITELMDQLATDNLPLETKEASEIFYKVFELSRQLEWGLSSSLIIKKIILNQNFTSALRYEAAILLSLYKQDPEAIAFWQAEAGEALPFYSFLSFPRFFFLSRLDRVNAFLSLEYFQKAEYIHEDDIRLPLEDFFLAVLRSNDLLEKIRKYYSKLQGWIKDYIENSVLSKEHLSQLLELNTATIVLGHPVDYAAKDKYENIVEFDNIKNFLTQRIMADLFLVNLNSRYKLKDYNFGNPDSYYRSNGPDKSLYIVEAKTDISNLINSGIGHFKKSEFPLAIKSYQKALEFFYERREEDVNIYYYSMMLHELANVYFVNTNFKRAKELYTESYCINVTLETIPKVFSFGTQLKILGILSYNPELHAGWDELLIKYIDNLTEYYGDKLKEKDANESNLIADAYYFLSNGCARMHDKGRFLSFYDKCEEFTKLKDDHVGLVKLKVLDYMYSDTKDALIQIGDIVSKMNEDEKKDPYLTTIFGDIVPGNLWKEEKVNIVKDLLLGYKVPLQIGYEAE